MSRFKVGIIGVGHVGAHVLYTLALRGLADDFVLVDLPENERKLVSEQQDVLDCAEFLPHPIEIRIGGYDDLADRDVIVNAVGSIILLKGTHTRTAEMEYNMHAIHTYAERLRDVLHAAQFRGVVINISNPCDVITKYLADILDLPKGRVFGTGTGLDTARLKYRLQRQTGIDAHSISAFMLGEHGNEQIAPWSACNFNGLPLAEAAKADDRFRFDLDEMEKSAREGGWLTYNGKFCTEYAIALTLANLVDAVASDAHAIVPVSCALEGEYGESGLFAGVPARIGRNGVESVVELPLDEREAQRFHHCCEGIRENIRTAAPMYR